MNATEATDETQKTPLATAAGGLPDDAADSALAKKRKKEALKPIVTNEGPQTGYVWHRAFLSLDRTSGSQNIQDDRKDVAGHVEWHGNQC